MFGESWQVTKMKMKGQDESKVISQIFILSEPKNSFHEQNERSGP